MADFVMLRKSRNALSTVAHIALNIALAVVSTALTIISGNWVFGVLLVLLSKWRVVSVRPRYWWLNIKSNLVDFIVGLSIVALVYLSGTEAMNAWHVILTIFYAIWLVVIKPQTSLFFAELQATFAVFFGLFASSLVTSHLDPLLGIVLAFIIGYGASRHVLMQGEDRDFNLTTFTVGLVFSELAWVFYHWYIVYRVQLAGSLFAIPQLPIVATMLFFTFSRGYHSALKHDGKIRMDDILFPAIFTVLMIVVMLLWFSKANFDV